MFRRLWDVLNKDKVELVVSSSRWMKEMITVSMEISPAPSKVQMKQKATNVQASKLTWVKVWTRLYNVTEI